MRLTQEQLDALLAKRVRGDTLSKLAKAKRSKFGNKKTVQGDKVFDSGHEARRWAELEFLQREGSIRNLQRQVPFDMVVNGQHVCTYIADAVYEQLTSNTDRIKNWKTVVEDSKSKPTRKKPEYVIKRKLMAACHGIEVQEVL